MTDNDGIGPSYEIDGDVPRTGHFEEHIAQAKLASFSYRTKIVLTRVNGKPTLVTRSVRTPDIVYLDELDQRLAIYEAAANRLVVERAMRVPASFIFDALMPTDEATDFLANIEELFPLWCEKHGQRRAQQIAKLQMARVLVGHWFGRVLSLGDRIANIVAKVARLS